MKLDEVINSSVEDLVPILSEFEVMTNFEDIDYVKALPLDYELVSLEEVKDEILHEKLLNINLLIAKIESLNDNPTLDRVLKSPSPFPIPVKDSDSFFKKSDTSLPYSDNSLPEFETFSDHTEEMNSGSTTTYADYSLPEPRGTDSRYHPRGRSRPHRLDISNEDCSKDRESFRGVGESYDDSYSHSYRDENRSCLMNMRRDNESPLSSVSKVTPVTEVILMRLKDLMKRSFRRIIDGEHMDAVGHPDENEEPNENEDPSDAAIDGELMDTIDPPSHESEITSPCGSEKKRDDLDGAKLIRLKEADWSISSSYFSRVLEKNKLADWIFNDHTSLVGWADLNM
nr:hypothetical protein [Tanacetum cinerariifolium]